MRYHNSSVSRFLLLVIVAVVTASLFALAGCKKKSQVNVVPGSLDEGFGTGGIVITPISSADDDVFNAVAVDSQDRYVVVGRAVGSASGDNDFLVVRYLATGNLDTSFDGDGIATVDFGIGDDEAFGVAIQPDGKIVVVGEARNNANRDFGIIRFNTNGSLDTSFNGGGSEPGTIMVDFANDHDKATAVAILASGQIVVTGLGKGATDDFAAIMLTAAGELDNSFSGNGKANFDFAGDSDASLDLVADGNEFLLAGHVKGGDGGFNFGVARIDATGSLVNTFDGDSGNANGFVETRIDHPLAENDFATSIAIRGNHIVVAGYAANGQRVALVRYHKDTGVLDTSFGTDGKLTLDFSGATTYSQQRAMDVAVQDDGKIVVVGYVRTASGSTHDDFLVARLNTNGTLDTTFGSDGTGYAITSANGDRDDQALGVALQTTKIVVVGNSVNAQGNRDAVIMRFNR